MQSDKSDADKFIDKIGRLLLTDEDVSISEVTTSHGIVLVSFKDGTKVDFTVPQQVK